MMWSIDNLLSAIFILIAILVIARIFDKLCHRSLTSHFGPRIPPCFGDIRQYFVAKRKSDGKYMVVARRVKFGGLRFTTRGFAVIFNPREGDSSKTIFETKFDAQAFMSARYEWDHPNKDFHIECNKVFADYFEIEEKCR